jgi:hypothetical protein
MDFDKQIELEHLLFFDRRCRACGKVKNLIDDFYLTRRNRGMFPSSYSYECKDCTKKRIVINRMTSRVLDKWEYPDW